MSGFSNMRNDMFYNPQDESGKDSNTQQNFNTYYEAEYSQFQTQQLDFQTFNEGQPDYEKYYSQQPINPNYTTPPSYPQVFTPGPMPTNFEDPTEFDEPPLLEELEIYPEQILEKIKIVLNPFRRRTVTDESEIFTKGTDLAGPLAFCIILALCLFISGSKVYFGYIYGLSVISVLMMYCLLSLMTSANDVFTITNVTSILGYSLIPMVVLSLLGVFVALHGMFGIILTAVAVLWSSLAASRLFVLMSGDDAQRPLIAYPCALVCGVFALLVVF